MRYTLFTLLIMAGQWAADAQTSDDYFKRPLVDVLEELKSTYNVNIKYKKSELAEADLYYAGWRLVPGNVEESLKNVLAPFDYTFVKQGEGIYKVKPFQYHLITPEEGAQRLEYLKTQYTDLDSWEMRKASLRACMIDALEIENFPNSKKPELILGTFKNYSGYRTQNIALETIPGLYITGTVYRPTVDARGLPMILCPNGHFGDGRYRESEQIRCATLARMGAIVVSYDLFGWGESALQVGSTSHRKSLAHTIQTNNALRLIDYFMDKENVDPERIGITGGSGGGSQTMLVSAIDDRIAVSVPVVMTSSYHSGGCPCESGKPIHLCGGKTNNAEIAAMMAPKPMLVVSDGRDWTQQVPEVEFPFIQRTYGFYNANENVVNVHFADEGHDYGKSKRMAMYAFMAQHLKLELQKVTNQFGEISEDNITVESIDEMCSFGKKGELMPQNAIRSFEELEKLLQIQKDR